MVRLLVLVSELFVVLKVRIIEFQISTAVLFVTTEASKLPLQGLNFTTACLYVTTEAKIVSTAVSRYHC